MLETIRNTTMMTEKITMEQEHIERNHCANKKGSVERMKETKCKQMSEWTNDAEKEDNNIVRI